MDVRFINPFLVAVQNLFDTMIDVPFTRGKPAIKQDGLPTYEVSSIIGISGDVSGCIVISLSKKIALELASELLGEKMETIDENCSDAIGEIANIIAGNAKTDFPVGNTSISVPTVVVGKHKVNYPTGIPIVSIPCKTGQGELVMDVAIKSLPPA